jgi:hypothetical protein
VAAAGDKPQQLALNTVQTSPSRAASVTDEIKQVPGTAETEAAVLLDRDGRIDLQMRLKALDHYTGAFDGSIGPRSREAIGEWQEDNGIVRTTFLTPEQHMLLVVQSDPKIAAVRAEYEAQKAAWAEQQKKQAAAAQKTKKQTASTTTTKKKQTAATTTKKKQQTTATTTRKKPTQTAQEQPTYRPRWKNTERPNDGASNFGTGLLLGTGVGLVIGGSRHGSGGGY